MDKQQSLEELIATFLEHRAGHELIRLEGLFDNPEDAAVRIKIYYILKEYLVLKSCEFLAHHYGRGIKLEEIAASEKVVKQILGDSI